MKRSHALSVAAGALLGVTAALTGILVVGAADASGGPSSSMRELSEAAAMLAAAAERFEAAADRLTAREPMAESRSTDAERTPVPDDGRADDRLREITALIDRLERVAASTAHPLAGQAGSQWDLSGIQANLRATGPRPEAIVRVARSAEEDSKRLQHDYLFRTASEVVGLLGMPSYVTIQDSGSLMLAYEIEAPAGGLGPEGGASVYVHVLDGFVWRIYGELK